MVSHGVTWPRSPPLHSFLVHFLVQFEKTPGLTRTFSRASPVNGREGSQDSQMLTESSGDLAPFTPSFSRLSSLRTKTKIDSTTFPGPLSTPWETWFLAVLGLPILPLIESRSPFSALRVLYSPELAFFFPGQIRDDLLSLQPFFFRPFSSYSP